MLCWGAPNVDHTIDHHTNNNNNNNSDGTSSWFDPHLYNDPSFLLLELRPAAPTPHYTSHYQACKNTQSFGFFLLPSMSPRIHIHPSGMPTIQDDSGSPRSHYSSRQVDRPIIYSCTFFFLVLLLVLLLLLLLLLLHLSCRGLSQ